MSSKDAIYYLTLLQNSHDKIHECLNNLYINRNIHSVSDSTKQEVVNEFYAEVDMFLSTVSKAESMLDSCEVIENIISSSLIDLIDNTKEGKKLPVNEAYSLVIQFLEIYFR